MTYQGIFRRASNTTGVVPRRRDDTTGRYTEVYSKDDILLLLCETRMTTSEVAEELGCHRTTAHDRLTTLETEGLIKAKEVGNTLIWELENE